jgi:hypothetical protein
VALVRDGDDTLIATIQARFDGQSFASLDILTS